MFNIFGKKKIGAALGSGGAKGIAHIAVLQYFDSLGVEIDMIAGSSIGALAGALYLTESLQDIKNDLLKLSFSDMLKMIDPVFPRSGIIQGHKITKYISNYIDKDLNIEDLPKPLTIIATDYYSGEPVYFKQGNLINAIRASISIPGVFTPVKNGDRLLIDGGVANPIPVDVVYEMGADKVVAVNLHPDVKKIRTKKMLKKPKEINSDNLDIKETKKEGQGKWYSEIAKYFEKKDEDIPSVVDIISQSIDIMELMTTHMLLKYYKPHVLIEPQLKNIQTLDFDKANLILLEGYKACKDKSKQIERRLK